MTGNLSGQMVVSISGRKKLTHPHLHASFQVDFGRVLVSIASSSRLRQAVDVSLATEKDRGNSSNADELNMAPSLAEADGILERFGYVDAELAVA